MFGNHCLMRWINIQKKEALRIMCFVWVPMSCFYRNCLSMYLIYFEIGQRIINPPVSLNLLGFEEDCCALAPFGSCIFSGSFTLHKIFILPQANFITLSLLNSRAFKTGSQQENASRTNNNHSNTKREST